MFYGIKESMMKLLFMRNLIFWILFMAFSYLNGQTPSNKSQDWVLIFEDYFDHSLDKNVWRVMNDYDHGGEPQIYTNRIKNVRVENGSLIIECHHENYKDHSYTSGYLDLKKDYKYGYFEIRCKQPLGQGLWPAFWFSSATSTTDGWPPEIDIFETNGKDASFTSGGIHVKENGKPAKVFEFKDYQQSIDEWHTYAIEWHPEIINWYVDDLLIASTTQNIPQMLRRLVLNLALFPWNPPGPDANYFPAKFEIDYIKIWERKVGNPYLSWKEKWKNQEGFFLDNYLLHENDELIVADFTGDGKEDLFIINLLLKKANLFQFTSHDCDWIYSNKRSRKIGKQKIKSSSKYFAGDFNGDGQAELVCLENRNSEMVFWDYYSKESVFSEKKGFYIENQPWLFDKSSIQLVGDFDGDGRDEIFGANQSNKKFWRIKLNQENNRFETNNVDGDLTQWDLNPKDQIIKGRFTKSSNDQILLFNSVSKKMEFFELINDSWKSIYSNAEAMTIGTWLINSNDILISGDFNSNGKDEILFINPSTYHTRLFETLNWSFYWSNAGNPNIFNWNIHPELGDKFMSGKFLNPDKSQIFVVRFSEIGNKANSKYNESLKAKMYEFLPLEESIEK